mmetsp:Transcript_42866/g.41189  ORF Transcript_42866/g.41189 Transcript_42866/m.41189 type:complete len:195 (+) Transcript_42866:493-1077(+)
MRRSLQKKHIDYRNTTLLTKFLNDTGKLLNKFQTRLETPVQRKMSKTVKHARHMGLIPHVGLIKPTDRISLGTFIEDLEEMHKKQVDPLTGRMFNKHPIQDDLKEKEKRWKEGLERRFEKVEELEEGESEKDEALRGIPLDNDQFLPDRKQRYWMAGQTHILERKEELDLEEERPKMELLAAKEAYDDIMGVLK